MANDQVKLTGIAEIQSADVTQSDDLAVTDDAAIGGDLAITGSVVTTGAANIGGAGTVVGSLLASAGGKIGAATSVGVAFYGTTTVSQRASANQASSLIQSNSLGTAGAAIMTEIWTTLTNLGLWKGSA